MRFVHGYLQSLHCRWRCTAAYNRARIIGLGLEIGGKMNRTCTIVCFVAFEGTTRRELSWKRRMAYSRLRVR